MFSVSMNIFFVSIYLFLFQIDPIYFSFPFFLSPPPLPSRYNLPAHEIVLQDVREKRKANEEDMEKRFGGGEGGTSPKGGSVGSPTLKNSTRGGGGMSPKGKEERGSVGSPRGESPKEGGEGEREGRGEEPKGRESWESEEGGGEESKGREC